MGLMRALSIDPGAKRFGLAVGDDRSGVVTPLEVLSYRGREKAVVVIAEFLARHAAEIVVVGLPTNADGEETPACARSHALVRALAEDGINTALQAEYLSSNEARRRARIAGRKPGDPIDDLAACVILEDFFAAGIRS